MEFRKLWVDFDDLSKGLWRISVLSASAEFLPVQFSECGAVHGLPDKYGIRWNFNKEKNLYFSGQNQVPTIIFSDTFIFADEALLIGRYFDHSSSQEVEVWLQRMTLAYSFVNYWTAYRLRHQIQSNDWDIGAYTYGMPFVIDERLAKLSIGRFCSIASGVILALGHHRMDIASTYPFQTLNTWVKDWPGAPLELDHGTNGDIVIGSDVWIASNVFIASGVKIGHGAVVVAGSVVTKDVPPYAIVGGNTAKLIRYRFKDAVVADLLKIQWWNWPSEKINRNLGLMINSDVKRFVDEAI